MTTLQRKRLSPETGFTLMEVMLSFAIMAVITSLLYGTFRTTLQTSSALDQKTEVYKRARMIFYQLNKDISMIYQKNPSPGSTSQASAGETSFGLTPFQGKDDVHLAEGNIYPADTVQFTSLSFQPVRKGVPFSGQAEISYILVDDLLMRRARFREKGIEHELGESVLGLNFRYFDGKKKEWQDEWESKTDPIPIAIEIELTLKPLSPKEPMETPVYGHRFKTTLAIETTTKTVTS